MTSEDYDGGELYPHGIGASKIQAARQTPMERARLREAALRAENVRIEERAQQRAQQRQEATARLSCVCGIREATAATGVKASHS